MFASSRCLARIAEHGALRSHCSGRTTFCSAPLSSCIRLSRPSSASSSSPSSATSFSAPCGAAASASMTARAFSSAAPAAASSSLRDTLALYGELSKTRLSALVVMTTSAGYLMADGAVATMLSQPLPFIAVSAGTALAACSANTFNQVWEIKNDALMKRTQNRPLPSGRMGKVHALAFGAGAGTAGTALLYTACNPLTAALGAANIALYSLVYTPMKVRSEWNTWAGAIVGAIPPLMGYAAACGTIATPAAALSAATLFLWQFPHFFALAWRLRKDYARGGFAMVPCADPTGARTADLVWRYSLYMAPLPLLAAAGDVTSWMFALEGTAINGYLLLLAHQFKQSTTTQRSNKVFLCSLWYLPVMLSLMIFHKKDGASGAVAGQEGDFDDVGAGPDAEAGASRGLGKGACVHEALLSRPVASEGKGEGERVSVDEK